MIDRLSQYNVMWNSPSENESGSMPLGNGDLALNAWVEPAGDLVLLLAKSDAWDENSINLKLGRVRIRLTPNPFTSGAPFEQTLLLATGDIQIAGRSVRIRIWVDANEPVIRVDVDADEPVEVHAQVEIWRTEPRTVKTQTSDMFKNLVGKNSDPYPTVVYPDRVLAGESDAIVWCHHNEKPANDPYEVNMRLQGLGALLDTKLHPLLHRTFGAALEGDGFRRTGNQTLQSGRAERNHRLRIHALTLHPSTIDQWQKEIQRNVQKVKQLAVTAARLAHERWWGEFWNRSWIDVTTDSPAEQEAVFHITQSYILQRFMNAGAGRHSSIKHNGSLYSVGMPGDPDFRRWGGPGFWFQNQRLIYWPMLADGDLDVILPWFRMYLDSLPLQRHRTEKYFHHHGAHFPETITFWGAEVSGHYGWTPFEQRARPEAECAYLTYYWTGGVELTLMLLECFNNFRDVEFARSMLLPLATAVIGFFDHHYQRDEAGKLRFFPGQSLETWHQAKNPTPEIAGLKYVIGKLLELPDELISYGQREQWKQILGELPPLPIGEKDGKPVVLPAQQFDIKKNTENPELYAVFPYRLLGLGKPDLELARNTFEARLNRDPFCWSQDDIQMALLGLTAQAKDWLIRRASPACHSESRFPGFWNAFHDWIPDVDHGGVLQLALQLMLIQCEGDRITLLPAWPAEWNADFKLHAPGNTIIEGSVQNGKLTKLQTTPEGAAGRVTVGFPDTLG